jgi:putative Mg2+ transporter-C (MgtC) family protein
MLPVISSEQTVIRLLLTTVIASMIGMEREYRHKPAGLRTNVMVGLGSTLMTISSIQAVTLVPGAPVDPTRIAAQIITGIGFIGAGAILRPVGAGGNQNVVGLTTAATLWVVSGIGIAVGMGFYLEAVATALLVFFTFFMLSQMVEKVREYTRKNPPQSVLNDEDVLNGIRRGTSHEQ